MCLAKLIEERELSSTAKVNLKSGIGYKVMIPSSRNEYSALIRNQKKYKINRWYHTDKRNNIQILRTHAVYKPNFHIFLTKRGAIEWRNWRLCNGYPFKVVQVKFKNVNTIGTLIFHPCVVVKDMIIKKEY